nr:uncharacterized protein K02A2.6-like [Hydra vulgaris]
MAQQLSRFNPSLAKVAEPLRDLLNSKSAWFWTENHTRAFNEVKNILTNSPILAHYDVKKPIKVRTDGSLLNGLSVIVYQNHNGIYKPTNCASRFLTTTEKNYYPIEMKMLAVTWGCTRMSKYLYGLPNFILETDHKTLIPILNYLSLIDMSPRIQRLRMKLLRFSFTAELVAGKSITDADAMSRAPVSNPTKKDEIAENDLNVYVNSIIKSMPATESRLEEIKQKTAEEKLLNQLQESIISGWPNSKKYCPANIQPYWDFKDEIVKIDGLLLYQNRIIIPVSMRRKILSKLLEGHLGMEKCKRRARQSVFWPGLNNQIEQLIRKCESANKNDLIIVAYYSLWTEVFLLPNTGSANVIKACKESFSRNGIPEELVSDNGTQYSSKVFRQFSQQWQFKHITSSPHYAKSNGLAEATIKSVKLLIKKCYMSNEDIYKGILLLCNTPIKYGLSPAELLHELQLRDNLLRFQSQNKDQSKYSREIVKERVQSKKYYDKNIGAFKPYVYRQGQTVAIQNEVTREWSLRGKIMKCVAPRSYEVKLNHNGHILCRNQIQLRKVYTISAQGVTRDNGAIMLR